MAVEVRIPKEITEYKEKVLFGLSIRQLICFTAAIILSVGSYLLLTKVLGFSMDLASYVIIIEALPLVAIGFIRRNGFTFEKYAALFWRHRFGQQVRPYKTELLIDQLIADAAEGGEERNGNKNAWIFDTNAKRKTERISERTTGFSERSFEFTETKEQRAEKREATLRRIKAAQQEYRDARRHAKKGT